MSQIVVDRNVVLTIQNELEVVFQKQECSETTSSCFRMRVLFG
eukprot:COSAG06_NODE_31225_length_525_cov_0.669014_2_plen_42_part_01